MNTNKQQDDESQTVPPSIRPDEVPEEVTKETAQMKHEEENDVDKKTTTTATVQDDNKEKDKYRKEEGDECPICLEVLPKDVSQFVRWTCCGNGMHKHCDKDLASMKMDGTCPLCRAKTPTSDEEAVKYLRPWVKKKKAWALLLTGKMYRDGTGVKQS